MTIERLVIKTLKPTCVKELVFLGTGTSSCIPLIGCLMNENPSCKVCVSAAAGGKNRRNNVSAALRWQADDGTLKSLLIDCGKTFYTAARRLAVPLKLGAWEAVLLSHGHADAMLGLDDLRHWTGHGCIQKSVDIWADEETMRVVRGAFPYLVDRGQATGGGFVSDLQFRPMTAGQPLVFSGLEVLPLAVEHGACSDGQPYMCIAFLFDSGRIAYFSDVSLIPDAVMQRMIANPPELLVLDCLREHRPYRSHFVLAESMAAVQAIKPKRTFLVGMTHDIDHEEFAERLRQLSPDIPVEPAFDGLVLHFSQ